MAISLQETIKSLGKKIEAFKRLHEETLAEKLSLEKENEGLRADVAALTRELQKAKTDNEFLALSHKLASDPDQVIKARRHIARLISDIDRCISQLKE